MIHLTAKTIGRGDGPHLLITAGVHGDEFEPMIAVRRLIRELGRRIVRGRISLVPVVNQGAFRLGRRTAADGLDLARTCPGSDDGSITQQTAAALTRLIRSADYYVDLHTGGALLRILPLAGYMLHSDGHVLAHQRRMVGAFNLPICWGTSAGLEGRSLSVARDAAVPAIYAEYGGGGEDPAVVEAYVSGCLGVAGALGLIEFEAAASRVAHVVEDDRPGSGHLQVEHPAPSAGFFEPSVELGQMVDRGQPLGAVIDELGEQAISIPASQSGLVFFLRAVASVQPGDALAGVMALARPVSSRAALPAVQ
jgi:predicted deacylase